MKNRVTESEMILWANASGGTKTAGSIVVWGLKVGVLVVDVPNNGVGACLLMGVFSYARLATGGTAWAQGDKIYFDAGNNRLTKVSTSNKYAGLAAAATADGDATGKVVLNFGSHADAVEAPPPP